MIFRKRGTDPTDSGEPVLSRADRRRRERDARRGIMPPRPMPEWRRRLEGGIRWVLRRGFSAGAFVVLVFVLLVVDEKVSDPRISLDGMVVDERGKGIEGATVEWSTSREGGLGWNYSGTQTTDEKGRFHVSSRTRRKGSTRRGKSLTIHRVSMAGYVADEKPRTFHFHKDPERVEGGSSKYVLSR